MEPARGRPLRVLVIDDDPAACALVRDMLVRLGHVATTSADGLAGLEAYRAGDFDVVVTDLDQLENVMKSIRQVEGVRSVERLLEWERP